MEAYQEKNRNTLLKGIQALPEQEAPPYLWPAINAKLKQEESMQEALGRLPMYPAPAGVWNNIAQTLDQSRPRPAIYRYLNGSARWAAAAIIAGLVLCTWWLTTGSAVKTTIAYSEEIQTQTLIAEDWQAEDQTMELVLQRVDRSPIADPVMVNRLRIEYDELTDARLEVEAMLAKYGKDEQLLKEAARIERERSQVIKALATWI